MSEKLNDNAEEIFFPRCSIPFQNMVIDADGNVTPCPYIICDPDLPNSMGNVNKNSIMEIWNGEKYKKLRTFMYSDEGINGCKGCLNMKQNGGSAPQMPVCTAYNYEDTDAWKNYLLFREDVKEKRTVLRAKPSIISYTESHKCNFRCIMCYQSYIRDICLENQDKTCKELFEILPYMSQLTAGGGEPLLMDTWKKLINSGGGGVSGINICDYYEWNLCNT